MDLKKFDLQDEVEVERVKPFRFLHAADLHLDSPFRGMMSLPSAIRNRIVESTFLALQQMIDVALRERVDFVVLSGDIYDLADRSLRAQIEFQSAMKQLAKKQIQVFVIHGNHDPMDGRKAALTWPDSIHFFSSEDVQMRPAYDRNGQVVAHIYGMSYPTAAVTENLSAKYKVRDHSMYNIAMLHCNVDGDQSHEHYAPCTKQELILTGMQYWALGHIHTRQVLYMEPYIVYPGNLQGRSVRELGPKGCHVVDVSEQGRTKLSFHNTDAVRWFHEVISINSMNTEQDLSDALNDIVEQIGLKAENRPAIVRVTMEGRGSLHKLLQRETEVQELVEAVCQRQLKLAESDTAAPFVWLESIKVKTGVEVDKEQLLNQDSFLGDMLRISQQLTENEEQLELFSEEALDALFSHHQAAKYIKAMPAEDRLEWLRTAEELAIHLLYEGEEWKR